MLTHQIVDRVQSLIEDSAYWTSARIKTLINMCKDNISEHFGVLCSGFNEFDSVVGQQSYMIPMDFVKLELLFWNSGEKLTPANYSDPKKIADLTSDLDETGVPEYWYLWGKYDVPELWIYPTFASIYTVQMWYWRTIPDIVNDNDEPILPRGWHNDIAEYCRRQIWLEDETRQYSQQMFDIWWESRLLKMQMAQDSQIPNAEMFSFGNFDDLMPGVGEGIGIRINTNDGVIW